MNSAPYIVGITYQLFGYTHNLRQKGVKAAISIEGGYYNGYSNRLLSYTGSHDSDKKVWLRQKTYGGSFNIGYRLDSQFILYLNSFYSYQNISGDIRFKSDGYVITTGQGDSHSLGSLLGVGIGPKKARGLSIIVELGISYITWPNDFVTSDNEEKLLSYIHPSLFSSSGVSVGYQW
ncbi:MAG TPA: hypothetical protein ENK06_10360 [Gammaproteobacteria bacterium]|nr:hypothetical protein [Gammaproteobacteria bacterium]